MQKLGFSPTANIDQRKLAIDLAEVRGYNLFLKLSWENVMKKRLNLGIAGLNAMDAIPNLWSDFLGPEEAGDRFGL